uniref:Uncharacterized protein n=1 Tax=Rhizophora mucronata TaxID=61149 RepID=A0A2P2J1F2_RHIMU
MEYEGSFLQAQRPKYDCLMFGNIFSPGNLVN